MFKRILVPLDGSARAEHALPVAAHIARTSGSSLILIQAIPSSRGQQWDVTEGKEDSWSNATHYLATIADLKELADIPVLPEVLTGPPAEMIFYAAHIHQNDLIVMSSHGYTGFTRWALGSVAQKVVHYSSVPVFVISDTDRLPEHIQSRAEHPICIMVALDGSTLAETTLVPAAYLSAALSAPAQGALHLVRILHLPSSFEYGQDDSVSRALQQESPLALSYLRLLEQRLHEGELAALDLHITTTIGHDLDIAKMLLKIAEYGEWPVKNNKSQRCDVIALATHGRSGLKRWVIGSVAERILSASTLPVFIVRPPQAPCACR